MEDERKWVPVEVTWDEGLGEEIEWPAIRWEDDLSFDRSLRPQLPPLPYQQQRVGRAPAFDSADSPRSTEAGPKRKQKDGAHLTKRRRKKLRAWEIEDEA